MCVDVRACSQTILSSQFFMSLRLWLCSDSTDGLNAVNESEQSSCLKRVRDHVQAFYGRDTSGIHCLHRANQDGQDCPGVGSLMQRPGGHERKCCEEKGKTNSPWQ